MELKFEVQTKIQKPVSDVFDAVYLPEKLSRYFTNGGAKGALDQGTTVEWAFEDTPGEEIRFPVNVERVVRDETIIIRWQGRGEQLNRVEFKFENIATAETIVRISESGWNESQDGLEASYRNCMGWSQMLFALKAFLEYGINLRKGAYGRPRSEADHS